MVLRFWYRKEWGSKWWRSRRKYDPLPPPIKLYHPVHHLVLYYQTYKTPCMNDLDCKRLMRRIQKHHIIEERFSDIAYNFMIGGDGTVYEGRGWVTEPQVLCEQHLDFKGDSIDIGYMGPWKEGALDVMNEALHELILLGIEYDYIHWSPEIVEITDEVIEVPQTLAEQVNKMDTKVDTTDVTAADADKTKVRRALRLVERAGWRASSPKYPGANPIYKQAEAVLVRYYADQEACYTDDDCKKAVYRIQQDHKTSQGMCDIGYNFLIAWNGTIFEGRGWKVQPENPGYNLKKAKLLNLPLTRLLLIGYIGDFEERDVTQDMKNSLEDLLQFGVEQGFLTGKHRLLETFRRMDYL